MREQLILLLQFSKSDSVVHVLLFTAAHFGIALPKWMIQKENFYVVIGAYVLLFMLILPIAVGTWWYNTMRFSNNNVLLDTIRYFCVTFMRSPYMAMPRVIKVLSNAYEFNPAFNKEIVCRPSDNTELPPLIIQIPIFTIFKKAIVGSPSSVKTRALIYAHLERIDLPAKTLYLGKFMEPEHTSAQVDFLLYCHSLFSVIRFVANLRHKTPQHLATIENCMHLVPMLVQALSDNASPLLQLPHIGQTQLRHMAAKQRNIKSIRQLVRFPDDKRRALLRSLSDEQYRDMLNVCASMPMLTISYRCEVLDDDDPSIWPLSMVTATVLLQRTPLFEPSSITSATAFQDLHYNGSGSTARSDSSAYDHVFNSQLYPAANPAGGGSGTVGGSVETGFDGANSMGYGDLGDEYPVSRMCL
ncbi:Translocation protein SEC63 [Fasciola gigantica]|uniref:Translocation protein SEC63 n=1 Tax=Fasciola gigantica TaxID=46835 RepID=A0A504YBJ6_FASGI|nr:Translocation protein SEC63 [Fasciola gigantica]